MNILDLFKKKNDDQKSLKERLEEFFVSKGLLYPKEMRGNLTPENLSEYQRNNPSLEMKLATMPGAKDVNEYFLNHLLTPTVRGVKTIRDPESSALEKGLGGLGIAGSAFQASPGGQLPSITFNTLFGTTAGGIKSARTGESLTKTIPEAVKKPTGFSSSLGLEDKTINIKGKDVPIAPIVDIAGLLLFSKVYSKGEKALELKNALKTLKGGDAQQVEKTLNNLMTKYPKDFKDLNKFMEGPVPKSVDIPNKEAITTLAGRVADETADAKVVRLIKEAEPQRAQQEALYSAERSGRLGTAMETLKKGEGEEAFLQARGTMKGALPKQQYQILKDNLTQEDIDSLFNTVRDSNKVYGYDKINAGFALRDLLGGEKPPTKGQIKLLKDVFGEEFVDTVQGIERSNLNKIFSETESALNLPRALTASLDLSAPMRQGVFLLPTHPKQWFGAFKSMFKQVLSEKGFEEVQGEIRSRPTYDLMRSSKLALTETGSDLSKREEAFMSRFSSKIPGVRASERAYVGFLNKLRADVFDQFVQLQQREGIDDPEFLNSAAKFVNAATGRGELGRFERIAPELNALLFSPRLAASRLNLINPMFYSKLQPAVRKEAIKSLLGFIATIATVASLIKLGGGEVGTDARSADFLKAKIGNTRIDLTGTYGQYLRAAWQFYKGEKLSSTTGKLQTVGEGYKPLSRLDILAQQIESKESPAISFAMMLLKGKDYFGQDPDIPAEIINRMTPFVLQDLYDIAKDDPELLPLGISAIFGVGVQTYGKNEVQFSENKLGESVVEARPVKGLGEDISAKLTEFIKGKPSKEEPYAKGSTDLWVSYLDGLESEEAANIYEYIKKSNPTLAANIKKEKKLRTENATPEEMSLLKKGVASGDRAVAIIELVEKKKESERAAYYQRLIDMGLVSDKVQEQVREAKR